MIRYRNKPGKDKFRENIISEAIRNSVLKFYQETKKVKYFGL